MSDDRPHAGDHIGALDGLRGLAALWVFLSHVQILTGMRALPVLSWGGSAVDLFMMISGFLMAHHYLGRAAVEPWHLPRTWAGFWLRRLFRIAPAYYLLLAVALAAGHALGQCRNDIGAHFPWTLTSAARYTDQSLDNIVAHVTFVFGALPQYAFRTPLPDWSIGLEMQFYLALPLLMPLIGRSLNIARALLVLGGAILVERASAGYSAHFEMPSFLPMRLTVFLAGMMCAYGVAHRRMASAALVVAAIAAWTLHRHGDHVGGTFAVMAAGFLVLTGSGSTPALARAHRLLAPVRRALASPTGHRAGEYAYSLYLVHLLVLLPVAALLSRSDAWLHLQAALRFVVVAAPALVISLAASALIHRWIERPGIAAGKALVRRLRRPSPVVRADDDATLGLAATADGHPVPPAA